MKAGQVRCMEEALSDLNAADAYYHWDLSTKSMPTKSL